MSLSDTLKEHLDAAPDMATQTISKKQRLEYKTAQGTIKQLFSKVQPKKLGTYCVFAAKQGMAFTLCSKAQPTK